MVKVAIVSSGLGHVHRGIESWARELAYALKENGVDVTLFKGGGNKESEIEEALPCLKRDSWLLGGKKSMLSWSYRYLIEQITFSIPLIFKLRKYDIVHLADPQVASLLVRAKKLGLIKCEIIFGTSLNVKDMSNLSKWPLAFKHLQLFAPYYLERAKEAGFDTDEWFVIPHFVDTEKFSPESPSNLRETLGIPRDAFVVLSVGAIQKSIKGMDYVIKEVSKLDDAYLIIAGEEGKETKDLLKLSRDLSGNRIFFMKNIPNEDMPPIYSSADVFVLGSVMEQLSIAILEAMSSGLPVVSNDYPVAAWVVGDGGELIDMTKDGELSMTLRKYIDKSYAKEKGNNARGKIEKMFSKKVVVENIMEMYKHVLRF